MNTNSTSILLIEDDEVDVITVKRAFRKSNIVNDLHVAHNGVEALELLNGPNKLEPLPKIVLLDLNMPKMNGIEFLERVRANERLKHLCVFVLTTSGNAPDREQAYDLNVAGYIVKPVDFDSFLNAINTLHNYWKLIEFAD